MNKYVRNISRFCFLSLSICLAGDLKDRHTLECKKGLLDCPEGLAKLVVSEGLDQWKCTGFLISDKILATNQHCLPEINLTKKVIDCGQSIKVLFPSVGQKKAEIIKCKKILSFSETATTNNVANLDFAFLELESSLSRRPFVIDHNGIKEHQKLTFWRIDGMVQSSIRKDTCSAIYNSLLFPFTNSTTSPVITLRNCLAEHGNSGSPILNDKGKVVAILEGMNNEKNIKFFKEKFKPTKLENIIKASNFSCITSPEDREFPLSSKCAEKKAEREFLTSGNEIMKMTAQNKMKRKEIDLQGIRLHKNIIYDSDYNSLALRPEGLFSAITPKCFINKSVLLAKSAEIEKSADQKYFRSADFGQINVCKIKFDFDSSMTINKAKDVGCEKLNAVFLFNPTEGKLEVPFYYVTLDNKGNLIASLEGSLDACK
jgi:hypothetical protein